MSLRGTASSDDLASVDLLARLRQVEAERDAFAERAGRAEAAADTLVAMLSHELRTPIQAIANSLELLTCRIRDAADEVPRPWILERIERAERSVGRLNRLVATFLSVAQISSGRLTLQREVVDVSRLVRDAVADLADDLAWSRIECDLVVAPDLRAEVDARQLEVVVANLVSNAIKYGERRPIAVAAEGDRDEIRIEVRDLGPGIPADQRSRLFQRFSRLPGAGRTAGFGLGLWICRELVEHHGGRITVESGPGIGTVFRVALPRGAGQR